MKRCFLSLILVLPSVVGCSSSPDDSGGGSPSQDAALDAHADGMQGARSDAGPDQKSTLDAAQKGDETLLPGDGGADVQEVDFARSPECAAFCSRLSQCRTCDPTSDCVIPNGSCAD